MEKRLARKGDKVVFRHQTGHKIKNLTGGKEYEVVQEPYQRTRGEWIPAKKEFAPDIAPYLTELYVQNDKGLVFGYSIKNFDLPPGVVADGAHLVEAEIRDKQIFFEELRSL